MRSSGGSTDERSLYVPLANLLNAVGGALRPKVFCVQELADQGAGHPDFGLYSTRQVQRGKPKTGQKSERGVVEVSTATVVRFADALDLKLCRIASASHYTPCFTYTIHCCIFVATILHQEDGA